MARMLNSNDSAARCIGCVRRHQRLIKQVVKDQELIDSMQVAVEFL